MTPSGASAFRALALEALSDAVRRRIVPVVIVFSLLSLMAVDSCTACDAGTFVQNGETVEIPQVAGWSSVVVFLILALWTVVLAGVLSSDHLTETLQDGSATLALARPVGRSVFVGARLSGALAVALAAGVVLLGATGALVHLRRDLPLEPLIGGIATTCLGAITVGALAMSASLTLPRIASALGVFAFVGAIAVANTLSQFGANLGGGLALIDRFGPPLVTAPLMSLGPWIEPTGVQGDPFEIGLRLIAWAAGSIALLTAGFRRVELGR